jgi:hypothetical protein
VHTGAPPWLEASEHDPKNLSINSRGRPSSEKGKSRKLNPKRVGAAWAERRRAEMEMEKRGEIVPDPSDSSWLPNFGSVWQSGTRKESRKEFEKKHKFQDSKSNNELPLEIKPYISKRMVTVISHFYIVNVFSATLSFLLAAKGTYNSITWCYLQFIITVTQVALAALLIFMSLLSDGRNTSLGLLCRIKSLIC